MKRTPSFALIIASWLLGGDAARAQPPGSSWQLVLEDEFAGTELDPTLWTIHTGPRRDAINTADAISVAEGNLTITTYTSGGRHYTGFISTRNSFLSTFGYWEARVRFDSKAGVMIRESLAANAKNAALFLKAGSRLELQSEGAERPARRTRSRNFLRR